MSSPYPSDLPATIAGAVTRAAELWPDDEAIVDRETRLTFSELLERADEAARAFVASGLEPGDRVSIWAPNSWQWVATALGLYAAGGVLVPISTRFKGTEAAHVLRTSGAKFLFTVTDFLDTNYVAMLEEAGARDLVQEVIVFEGPEHAGTTGHDEFRSRSSTEDRADH